MVNTLSKFGVPPTRGSLLQPKLQYRFRILVNNFGPISGGLDFTKQVISASRPTISYETIQLHTYNSRMYVAGKHEWDTVSVALRDDITNSVSRLVGHQVQKQMNHFEQTAFGAGVNYKFQMQIENLDGDNETVLEHWDLEGCWLQNVNYSDLDYSATTGIQQIDLTVRYDNATQADGLMTQDPQEISGTSAG